MLKPQTSFNSDRVVLLITDRGYIIPTLVAACQLARQRSKPASYDILILLLDFTHEEEASLRAEFSPLGLVITRMEQDLFNTQSELHFEKSHVPKSTMARLSSADYLSDQHKHVIYIDGDVQITGDIAPLLTYTVSDGKILAAPDRYVISKSGFGYSGKLWRAAKSYLDNLGIKDPSSYFNAGVLAARKETWASICKDALDFYKDHSSLCLFHDQSALNVVSQGRRDVLSPRYNFSTPFAAALGTRTYKPVVVHFTGSDKPWLFERRPPWQGFGKPYLDILQRHPILKPYADGWGANQAALGPDAPAAVSAAGAISRVWRNYQSRVRLDRYLKRQNIPFD